jgi:hypothetical protein
MNVATGFIWDWRYGLIFFLVHPDEQRRNPGFPMWTEERLHRVEKKLGIAK